jgi:hypothetical protein
MGGGRGGDRGLYRYPNACSDPPASGGRLSGMAAFTDIATLQFQAHLSDGQAIRNTLHFRRNPTAGSVDATWLADWLAASGTTSLVTAYRAILRSTDRLDGMLARATRDPSNPGDERDESFSEIDLAGTRTPASTAGPDELTTLLKVNGDLAGRRYRGRLWLPPPLDGAATSGGEYIVTSTTYWTNVGAFLTELGKTLYTAGAGHYSGAWNDVDMVVFSRAARLAGDTYYARVPSVGRSTKLHWLRSRNPTLS